MSKIRPYWQNENAYKRTSFPKDFPVVDNDDPSIAPILLFYNQQVGVSI